MFVIVCKRIGVRRKRDVVIVQKTALKIHLKKNGMRRGNVGDDDDDRGDDDDDANDDHNHHRTKTHTNVER